MYPPPMCQTAAQQSLALLMEAGGTPGWAYETGPSQKLQCWVKHPTPRLGDRAVTALGDLLQAVITLHPSCCEVSRQQN